MQITIITVRRIQQLNKGLPLPPVACRKRRLKWVLGAWGYNWATQSPGDINMKS
jgi:hypothetical protein